MNPAYRFLLPFVYMFISVTCLLSLLRKTLVTWEMNYQVLQLANLFFLLVSLLVFFILKKSMASSNSHVFIRSVMAGMMLKMFLTVIIVLVYALSSGSSFSKYSVFGALFIYLFYLVAEVVAVLKLNKKPDA